MQDRERSEGQASDDQRRRGSPGLSGGGVDHGDGDQKACGHGVRRGLGEESAGVEPEKHRQHEADAAGKQGPRAGGASQVSVSGGFGQSSSVDHPWADCLTVSLGDTGP